DALYNDPDIWDFDAILPKATSGSWHRPDVQQMMNDPNSANNPQSSQQIPMQPYGAPPQQYKAPQGPPQYV
ncbi:hypothetical protein D6C83_06739, partial [Aureobasidium pullulans]